MLLMAFVEEGNEQAKVKKISCKKVVIDSGVLGCLLEGERVGGASLCRGFAESMCPVGVRSDSAWFTGVASVGGSGACSGWASGELDLQRSRYDTRRVMGGGARSYGFSDRPAQRFLPSDLIFYLL